MWHRRSHGEHSRPEPAAGEVDGSDGVSGSRPVLPRHEADLTPGGLLNPGYSSNYGERRQANFVYLTATLDAAIWRAELAVGDGAGRIYRVEPTDPIEDDPNLTDKKFPGNPTRSYRTQHPLRVIGEVSAWQGHPPDELQAMRDRLEELKRLGIGPSTTDRRERRAETTTRGGDADEAPPTRDQ